MEMEMIVMLLLLVVIEILVMMVKILLIAMLMFNEVIIILRVTILEADVRKNSRRALTIEEGNNVDNVASLVSTLHFYYYSELKLFFFEVNDMMK